MPMTPKEMIKHLKKNGFEEIRQNDSHITRCQGQKMPDELFRAAHSHNSAPNSDIVWHTPHFYPHVGAGHKVTKPLMCKHTVVYDF